MNTPLDQSGKESVQLTVVGGIANLALSLSSALIADAIYSLSDLLSDAVTLWAIYISRRPIDDSLPYGHGKFEAVGTFFISLMLILAGFGIATHSINQLNKPVVPRIIAVWVAQTIVNTFQKITALTHVLCHYPNETLLVEIGIAVDPFRQINEAKEIARDLKSQIEQIDDIHSADIHLEI